MNSFTLDHAEILYLRFCAIFGEKFVKAYHTEDFKSIWSNEWCTGLVGIDVALIKSSLDYCRSNLEWPPSIAEFRCICESADGIPSFGECLQLAICRDFTHPVVSMAYDRIGSWAMKNDKQELLHKKFQEAYREALNTFRTSPDKAWQLLEKFKSLPVPDELPPKILSPQELIEWRERFARYKEMAATEKAKLTAIDHPSWETKKITIGHIDFDQEMFIDRKQYLTGLDEMLAATLPREDQYDRIRLLREEIGCQSVQSPADGSCMPPKDKNKPCGPYGARTVYKNWMSD